MNAIFTGQEKVMGSTIFLVILPQGLLKFPSGISNIIVTVTGFYSFVSMSLQQGVDDVKGTSKLCSEPGSDSLMAGRRSSHQVCATNGCAWD